MICIKAGQGWTGFWLSLAVQMYSYCGKGRADAPTVDAVDSRRVFTDSMSNARRRARC